MTPSQKAIEQEIEKQLGFIGRTDDKAWLQASVKHYLESGKPSGSFYQALVSIATFGLSLQTNAENKSHEEILEKHNRNNILIPRGGFVWKSDALLAMAEVAGLRDKTVEVLNNDRLFRIKEIAEYKEQLTAKDKEIEQLKAKITAQKEHIEHQKNEIEWLKN